MMPTVSKEHWHSKLIKFLNICDVVLRPLYGFLDNSMGKKFYDQQLFVDLNIVMYKNSKIL